MQTESHPTVESSPRASARPERVRVPAVDVFGNEKEFRLVADVPGVPADGVTVELDRGQLRLEARRSDGSVYRRLFAISDRIDAGAIEARLDKGVLTVRLPKIPEVQPRKVPVTAG